MFCGTKAEQVEDNKTMSGCLLWLDRFRQSSWHENRES